MREPCEGQRTRETHELHRDVRRLQVLHETRALRGLATPVDTLEEDEHTPASCRRRHGERLEWREQGNSFWLRLASIAEGEWPRQCKEAHLHLFRELTRTATPRLVPLPMPPPTTHLLVLRPAVSLVLRILVSLVAAANLARHGLRKRSLAPSGASAAFAVGFLSLACGYRFGLTLLLFYWTSSKLTKVGKARKEAVEEGVGSGEGERNYVQVLSCSLVGVIFSAAHVYVREGGLVDAQPIDCAADPVAAFLAVAYLAHFAACNGDTWASEVGILTRRRTYLITTLRPCPPGTNGGISVLGTTAATAGGGFIGLVFALAGSIEVGAVAVAQTVPCVLMGSAAGLLGSTVDSVLGATLQESHVNIKVRDYLHNIQCTMVPRYHGT